MPELDKLHLPPESLRSVCDPESLPFDRTDELAPLGEFIGQERGVRALEFGLALEKPGYNIFVTGLTGTGKATAIREYIQRAIEARRAAGQLRLPDDWCYVYNFEDPDRPNAVRLPAGGGRSLRHQLEELLSAVRSVVSRAFTSEDYEQRRRELMETSQREAQKLIEITQEQARSAGFLLRYSPVGVALIPLNSEGKPMKPEEFAELDPAQREEIEARQRQIMESVEQAGERLRALEREMQGRLRQLDRQIGEAAVSGLFASVIAQNSHLPEVASFLERLREFTVAHIDLFRDREGQPQQAAAGPAGAHPDPFLAFRCNVLVDNSGAEGPPIVIEPNPTWTNLFGKIERRAHLGTYFSDHTLLKPGAVHLANGGYLILNLMDILTKPGSWEGLKRVIRTQEVRLEDPLEQFGFIAPQALRPEPIPVQVKVVVTGDPLLYYLLAAYDEDFWEIFKVKADFDIQIDRTPENVDSYARFIRACCQRDHLRPFDRTAVARIVEHGSRTVSDQEKLSSRFGQLRDIIIQADFWAAQEGAEVVTGRHVQRALDERIYRLNLLEERIRELIARGVIMVDVDGAVVGQVNGLSVIDLGEFSFGRPSRITARTFLGQKGVVSIERESQLSGRIHDKGVLILSGYLGWKYAQDRPLSISASISFEQAYEPVEGDSASLAELCAVLSSLADIPLRQDLAVTGSVNQRGEIQPVGGLNEKIEGFHDICRVMGFTGRQGVIIPSRNRRHLMLRDDVVESVRGGRFHIYAVDSVDQALELLTGLPAGQRQADGTYPAGSINARVEARLREMAEAMRRAGRQHEPEGQAQ